MASIGALEEIQIPEVDAVVQVYHRSTITLHPCSCLVWF